MTRRVRPGWPLRMTHLFLPLLANSLAMGQEPPAVPEGGEPAATQGPGYVLSIQDAVKSALENNLNIVVSSYDPLSSETGVIFAESILDPSAFGSAESKSTQSSSALVFVPTSKTHSYVAS